MCFKRYGQSLSLHWQSLLGVSPLQIVANDLDLCDAPGPDLLLATPDIRDARIDSAMQDLLRLIRRELAMEVAFLAEFVDGRRVFRHVETAHGVETVGPGDSHELSDSLCERVVNGSIPGLVPDMQVLRATQQLPDTSASLGAHAGVPVRLRDGTLYGTLCCFSFSAQPTLGDVQLQRLLMSAQLAGRLLDDAEGCGARPQV